MFPRGALIAGIYAVHTRGLVGIPVAVQSKFLCTASICFGDIFFQCLGPSSIDSSNTLKQSTKNLE